MKFLRTKGVSFTDIETDETEERQPRLARGLDIKVRDRLTPKDFTDDRTVRPPKLASYVGEDYALILRQTVSIFDKIIRKPRSLRSFQIDAYVDRTLLSVELWKLLREKCEKGILELDGGEEAFGFFEETWLSKVHPYARLPFDPKSPRSDKNGVFIFKHTDPDRSRQEFEGRWHAALWRTDEKGKPDYRATAKAVFDHLFSQELAITGDERKKRKKRDDNGAQSRDGSTTDDEPQELPREREPSGMGLIEARGLSMANSARDPRAEKHADKLRKWECSDEDLYFVPDIAAAIFEAVVGEASKIVGRPNFLNASWFGEKLYEHFGKLLTRYKDDEETRKRLWALHNKVRQFYRKLAKSERFRRAFRNVEELDKLKALVPSNMIALLDAIDAKRRNADIGELIRLGKLVLHASDLPFDTGEDNLQAAFEQRLDYLVTSAGQSEIKRNEAFTRVLRNSVALTQRTLKGWIDPPNRIKDDLATVKVAINVMREFDNTQFLGHLPIVFGNRVVAGRSRASLFEGSNDAANKEMLWSMLRLAGEIRNRTNHFNTKRQMIDLVTNGILEPVADKSQRNFSNRKSYLADADTLSVFGRLLELDIEMQRQAIADTLNQLDVTRYLEGEHLDQIIDRMTPTKRDVAATPPKFMTVLKRANNLASNNPNALPEPIVPFAGLDLDHQVYSTDGPNRVRIGLLRQLYATGFHDWLHERENDRDFIRDSVLEVVRSKKARSREAEKESKRFYAQAHSFAEELELESAGGLAGLFDTLTSWSAGEERVRQTYNPDKEKQRQRSNWLDEFKQDLFGYFFGVFLDKQGLNWIWEIRERPDAGEKPVPVSPDRIKIGDRYRDLTENAWCAQFYAWLYLIPSDDVALLRHQFRKTSVLEEKGGGETDPSLIDNLAAIDRLMALYTAVQSTGFDGTEHIGGLSARDLFYEDPDQFDRVYSSEYETHQMSLPGIRRGLRQILRFGHLEVLRGIFERHRVTTKEVEAFTSVNSTETADLFSKRPRLRDEIYKLVDKSKPDAETLKAVCKDYEQTATNAALYNFRVAGARLSDHARLHHLMMRIVGRLTDYTMLWERDRHCLFLGMLYRQLQAEGVPIQIGFRPLGNKDTERDRRQPRRVGLLLDGEAKSRLLKNRALIEESPPVVNDHDLEMGFLPLWDEERGVLLKQPSQAGLLHEENRTLFDRFFGKLDRENHKDVAIARLRKSDGDTPRTSQFRRGKTQIRNDFAHFNVITAKKTRVNLTYLVNAVRSLLSYDRKLKNAVSKSVAKILHEEGLVIEWMFDQDRLSKPRVSPRLETHLDKVRPVDGETVQFKLPQASIRFTSMVKALFDFERGGYRELVDVGGRKSRRGELRYPADFRARNHYDVPQEMFDEFLDLPQK